MGNERVVGHIVGVSPGETFPRRRQLFDEKMHGDLQRGISRMKDEDGSWVSDAIVLNGGYEDDEDEWYTVRYTGASPDEDKYEEGRVKKLKRSQSWDYQDNDALKLSYERGYPIRVIRGHGGDKRYSPGNCYRYDGLYEITEIRTAVAKSAAPDGSQIEICQYDLARLPEDLQEVTSLESRTIAELRRKAAEEEDRLQVEKFPERRLSQIQRIVRDNKLTRRIKKLYEDECQLCGLRLVGADGKSYSEGAHIKPLGNPHGGPDVEPNILCLCPNCHVRLDIGAIVIEDDWSIVARAGLFDPNLRTKLKRHGSHKVHPEYVRHHREWWQQREA